LGRSVYSLHRSRALAAAAADALPPWPEFSTPRGDPVHGSNPRVDLLGPSSESALSSLDAQSTYDRSEPNLILSAPVSGLDGGTPIPLSPLNPCPLTSTPPRFQLRSTSTCSWAPSSAQLWPRGGATTEAQRRRPS
jgi:hypothetical protein